MTFFELFFHCLTFVIGKCLAIVLLVVTTVFVPRFSEGNLSTTRNNILKFSHGGAVLLIKPSDELYRFLPFVTNGGIGGRPNIKQDADIQEGFSKISGGSVKINESSNLSVSVFSEEMINNSADANANKKTETYLDQIEDIPRPYALIHIITAFFGVSASVFWRESYGDRVRIIRYMTEKVTLRLRFGGLSAVASSRLFDLVVFFARFGC